MNTTDADKTSASAASRPLSLVCRAMDPLTSGPARLADELARHWSQQGHAVTLLAGHAHRGWRDTPLPYRLKTCMDKPVRSALSLWRFSRWAQQQITEHGPDTALSLTALVPASVVLPLEGLARLSLVRQRRAAMDRRQRWQAQMLDPLRPALRMRIALEQRTLARDARHVRHRLALGAAMARMINIDAPSAEQEPWIAAELPAWDALQHASRRETLRQAYGLHPDTTVFLFAAFRPWAASLPLLMQALAQLVEQEQDVALLLAGSMGWQASLLAEQHQVRSQVRIVGQTREMASLLAAVDATLCPARDAACSRLVVESLAMGVPCITTDQDGAAELVQAQGLEDCGRVVEADGRRLGEQLLDAMRTMCDRPTRQAMATACQRHAGLRNINPLADRLLALLLEAKP